MNESSVEWSAVGRFLYCPLRFAQQAREHVDLPGKKFFGQHSQILGHLPNGGLLLEIAVVRSGTVEKGRIQLQSSGFRFFRPIDPPRERGPYRGGMRLGLEIWQD